MTKPTTSFSFHDLLFLCKCSWHAVANQSFLSFFFLQLKNLTDILKTNRQQFFSKKNPEKKSKKVLVLYLVAYFVYFTNFALKQLSALIACSTILFFPYTYSLLVHFIAQQVQKRLYSMDLKLINFPWIKYIRNSAILKNHISYRIIDNFPPLRT